METLEEWLSIPSFERYEASTLGNIRNAATGRVLKPWVAGRGYLYVCLGRKLKTSIHRLVCATFHGAPSDERNHVAHFDGAPTNNRPSNLRWASRSENVADSIRHGTVKLNQFRTDGHRPARRPNAPRGVDAPGAKLNPLRAAEIRAKRAQGAKWSDLSADYGVSKSTIYRVLRNELWE